MPEIEVKLRPILVSGEMVPAVLDGSKTQARYVVKPQPDEDGLAKLIDGTWQDTSARSYQCPYGQPGDRLWVRESFHYDSGTDDFYYSSDNQSMGTEIHAKLSGKKGSAFRSIFMPRWASRITLELTDVRVERLQQISEGDAMAEGAPEVSCDSYSAMHEHLRDDFCVFWDSLSSSRGYAWDSNPWVWVVSFVRMA